MRHDHLYLEDIVEAANAIDGFVQNVSREEFIESDLIRSAVLQKLLIIGEAAARLSKPFLQEHPDAPWKDIVGFRNIAIHAYFSVDWKVVWVAATKDAPLLRKMVQDILDND